MSNRRLPQGIDRAADAQRPRSGLISGVPGEDGSYLAEPLPANGYEAFGLPRRASSFSTRRLKPIYRDPYEAFLTLVLKHGDLGNATGPGVASTAA